MNLISTSESPASQLPSTLCLNHLEILFMSGRDPASLSPLAHPPGGYPAALCNQWLRQECVSTGWPKVWQEPPIAKHHSCQGSSAEDNLATCLGKKTLGTEVQETSLNRVTGNYYRWGSLAAKGILVSRAKEEYLAKRNELVNNKRKWKSKEKC